VDTTPGSSRALKACVAFGLFALLACAGARPSAAAPQGTGFRWTRTWSEAQAEARTRGCLVLVASTRRGCTLCEAFRNQIAAACASDLAPMAVGYVYDTDRPESALPDRVLRTNLPRAKLLPLVGFLTSEGGWVNGFWGPRKVAQFRGDIAHARQQLPARVAAAPAPVAAPAVAPRATPPPQAPAQEAPVRVAPGLASGAPATSSIREVAAAPAAAASQPAALPATMLPAATPPTPTAVEPVRVAATPAPAAPSDAPDEEDLESCCPGGMCHLDPPHDDDDAALPSGLDVVGGLDLTRLGSAPKPATLAAREPVRRALPPVAPSAPATSSPLSGSPDGAGPAVARTAAPTLGLAPALQPAGRAKPAERVPSPARASEVVAPSSDPVIAAARAGRFREAFERAASWDGARRVALERTADAWAEQRFQAALLHAGSGRHDAAEALLEEVRHELSGLPQAAEAARGIDAVDALRTLRRTFEPDSASARAARETQRAELGSSRWARLFAESWR
jgi:hypothetical protein